MAHSPVFLSYARASSRAAARAVCDELGGPDAGLVFLDTEQVDYGVTFPRALANALLDARVAVLFLDDDYFSRWYCLLEMRLALIAYHKASRKKELRDAAQAALRSVVLVLSPGLDSRQLQRFPGEMRAVHWPSSADPPAVAAIIAERLNARGPTLREQLDRLGGADAERDRLLDSGGLPPPGDLSETPVWPASGLSPSLGDAFVGRTNELWQIHDALTHFSEYHRHAGNIVSVEAGAGFGKSRLVIEYVRRFSRDYPGGIFWIDATQDLEHQHYGILSALEHNPPPLTSLRKRPGGLAAALGRRLRSRTRSARALIVLDNLPVEARDAPPDLSHWIPCIGDIPAIITTRGRISVLPRLTIHAIDLEVLERPAAVLLLTTALDSRDRTKDEWGEITEWVGNLPLALELLNRAMRAGALASRAVLQAARERNSTEMLDDAVRLLRHQVPSPELQGVSQAIELTVDTLTWRQIYAAMMVAQLAPQPVPQALFDSIEKRNLLKRAPAWMRQVFSAEVRAVLISRSIITIVESGDLPLYGSMHRVMIDYFRLRTRKVEESIPGRLARFVMRKPGEMMVLNMVKGLDSFFQAEQLHTNPVLAAATLPHAEEVFFRAIATGVPAPHTRKLLFVGLRTADLLNGLGAHARARTVAERVVEGMRAIGEETQFIRKALRVNAVALDGMGEYRQALELRRLIVRECVAGFGQDAEETLAVQDELAVSLGRAGEFAAAEALARSTVTRATKLLGKDHDVTLEAMDTLAFVLNNRGKRKQATTVERRVVEGRKSTLGEMHRKTLSSMLHLAVILGSRSRRNALELAESAYAGSRDTLGEAHPTTLRAGRILGSLRRNTGGIESARELLAEVHRASTSSFGKTHELTTGAAWELFQTLLQLRLFSDAHAFHVDQLDWMLERDPSALTPYQRDVRVNLIPMTRLCRPATAER